MKIPVLMDCEALVAGSGINAMVHALSLRAAGQTVTLISLDTCLYAEMTRTGDFRVPKGLGAEEEALLFPAETYAERGLLHPDRLKCYGERLFRERGIRLLYACELLGSKNGLALIAHKSGLYGIACKEVFDCREAAPIRKPCYCLHTMRAGEHQVTCCPTAFAEEDAKSQWSRYETALASLQAGDMPARGGSAPSDMDGLRIGSRLREANGKEYPVGTLAPRSVNPLHKAFPLREVSAPACEAESYDVVIVGGGTAGASAAIYSARQGMKTLLIEMNRQLGGTATVGGVSTYWFGLRDGATAKIDAAVDKYYKRFQLPRRTCLWNDNDVFSPAIKAHALLGLCLEAGVEVRFGCVACGVEKEASRVTGVYYAYEGAMRLARGKMVLDCTGDGDICMFAGAAHTYGSERDGMTYWGSLAQYTTPDNYRNNFSTMVHVGDPLDYTRFILSGRQRGEGLYDHGQYVAVRESRHIKGMETLTLEKIVGMEPVPDPLYTCFSNYDPKGRLTADLVYFGLLPPNQRIAIPRGAVIPVDKANRPIGGLLTGGKAISCTHDAFPGVRMQPDLQRQGAALAVLAACAIRQNVDAGQAEGVSEALAQAGCDAIRPPVFQPDSIRDVVFGLKGDEKWEWLDASPDAYVEEAPPVARVMTAPRSEALPLLKEALMCAQTPEKRLLLSRLLLWHGDESGVETVMEAASAMLDGCDGLPRRAASVNYGQLLPDHGLMPEVVYLLNSLAHAPHTQVKRLFLRVLDRLERGLRDWLDLRSGIYCYCECFAYVAVKRGDAGMLPMLHRVLALPEFNLENENPLLRERQHMLRITLLGALHALGDEAGTQGLTRYLGDERRPLALAAEMLLK